MNFKANENYSHGITCVDTGLGRPGLAACYLMEEQGRLAIIETGIAATVPRLLALIAERGYSPEQVDYVIITHVHLDHAGGAGGLMQALPKAKLVVHPRGARHMIDPAKLQAGAMAVYGEERYRATYGELIPVPEDRVIVADDNFSLNFNGRILRFYDTPGHAKHHFCVYDEVSCGIFTGDTLGIVYPELCNGIENFVMPTTTPIQFEPKKLQLSIDRLFALKPDFFYLTHYGRVQANQHHVSLLKQQLDDYVEIANQYADQSNRQEKMSRALLDKTLQDFSDYHSPLSHDECRELVEMDMSINAQGLDVWLANREKVTT